MASAKPTARIYSLDAIGSTLDELAGQSNIGENIYNSLDYLLRCAAAILETDGEAGWSARVAADDGTAYFAPSEQSTIESAISPLVPVILYLFGKRDELPTTGGDAEASRTIDGAYDGVVKYLTSGTDVVRKFGKEHGIIHMIEEQEQVGDLRPFTVFGPAGAAIPVPPRAAFTLFYLALDVTRMLIAVPFPGMRKVMSIMLAIVDILRGEWKAALLSFAGFYGENPMLAGVFGKVMLESFNLISPALKDSIIYGFRDVIKSLAFGLILFGLQTFAPWPVRAEIQSAFQAIQEFLNKETTAIASEGLVAKPAYFRQLSFGEIQNLQPILSDATRSCSYEIQSAIVSLRKTTLGKNALQIMGIPITDEEIQRRCGTDTLNYAKRLADDRYEITKKLVGEGLIQEAPQPTAMKFAEHATATAAPAAKQQGGGLRRAKYALLYQS